MTFTQELLQEQSRLEGIIWDCKDVLQDTEDYSAFIPNLSNIHFHDITCKVLQQAEADLELNKLLIKVEEEANKKPSQTRYWTRSSVTGTKERPIIL